MMRRVKVIQISLILAISFCILVLPVHFSYISLAGVDLSSTDLSIEKSDQDILINPKRAKLEMFISFGFSVALPLGATLLNQLQSFSFQIPSFDQRTPVLRC